MVGRARVTQDRQRAGLTDPRPGRRAVTGDRAKVAKVLVSEYCRPACASDQSSPSTESIENPSSTDSPTSTTSQPARPALLQKDAGQHPNRIFEPNTVRTARSASGSATRRSLSPRPPPGRSSAWPAPGPPAPGCSPAAGQASRWPTPPCTAACALLACRCVPDGPPRCASSSCKFPRRSPPRRSASTTPPPSASAQPPAEPGAGTRPAGKAGRNSARPYSSWPDRRASG
jgi:hypothetical protein